MQGREPTRVLVVGPRRGLIRALDELEIPYVVWTDQEKTFRRAEQLRVAPVSVTAKRARREAETLQQEGPFSHVIAGAEGAVVAASVARRVLGARQSSHSTVIRCRDKLLMKQHLHEHGIPMTPFLAGDAALDPSEIVARLGLPLVAKRRAASGGRGLEIVHDLEALPRVARRSHLLERFVDAPEASVESFVDRGEIRFTSTTDYARKTHVNVVPGGIEEPVRASMLEINRRVIRALKIQWGMTHAEFYRTPQGVLFGEIALRPPGGYIMELLPLAWGFDAWRAFVAMELDQPFEFPSGPPAHAAALVLHPGAGRVKAVHGLARVRRHAAVTHAALRVRAGHEIEARAGVGSDVGHLLLRAATHAGLLEAIRFVDEELRIELEPA